MNSQAAFNVSFSATIVVVAFAAAPVVGVGLWYSWSDPFSVEARGVFGTLLVGCLLSASACIVGGLVVSPAGDARATAVRLVGVGLALIISAALVAASEAWVARSIFGAAAAHFLYGIPAAIYLSGLVRIARGLSQGEP